ncbi:phytanoyl-CoA dioxygenase family protein [Pyxidicoccus xibeiensis]|uniref:phytanoyl-CoA dioxygenase family protein n=1 Tax=Pyxidicoccus xibeiensis TaxID=2906759 RepID=UPI0020A7D57E|nr:phytanoyl-CoA dioxygenase family protein [Pyxidicoccus xibeiensis]MCP3136282.1 phytanoyl-CoA dioxygenase family protein [Pyxidicoccus xibeiensis]
MPDVCLETREIVSAHVPEQAEVRWFRVLGEAVMTDRAALFEQQGYLVLPGFVPPADCDALKARAEELVAGFRPETVSIFTTHEQTRTSDDYFLSSGDRIHFFFEEGAFRPDGSLKQDTSLSINKMGHALHDLDPRFDRFSRTPALAALASELGLRQPRLLQSMYIFKQPHIGGEVNSHQDATFLYTEPSTCLGFWFALEDATLENGCLWALPGGHRLGLKKRFVRAEGGGTTFRVLDTTPVPEQDMVPLEVEKGSLVVLHGLLPHRSGPNTSPKSRHAYSVHLIDATAAYPEENWLHRSPDMPLRGF